MESYSRIRSVKLKRPTPEHPFGLSVRGGHEHGTGIFVSSVTPRSIAHRQGLKIGDQILRVNGYPVSSAVHHECLSLMKVRTSLHLKVRSVGMLPVRERNGDPLTWQLIEEVPDSRELTTSSSHVPLVSRMSDTSSQPDSRIEYHGQEAKIYINTSGQSGLGCCICKGPPERPGIFVQSTKSNGVAREAGLRPGDQILHCNGHSFLNIQFAEAVYHLKSSKHLTLAVIKGAASDLFPGESSGYNSSASSLNGETHLSVSSEHSSPSSEIIVEQHEHPKRLSMVTEEQVTAMEERGLIRRKNTTTPMALDRNMEWDEVEQVWHSAEKESIIIEVKGEENNSTTRLRNEEARLLEERKKIEEEQKRLVEEANRLEEEKRKFEEEKRRTMNMSTTSSITSRSSSSSESTNGLAGALTQEILKRNERREQQESLMEDDRQHGEGRIIDPKKALFAAPIDDEKRQQHEQLIEEFKRAHRKMFSQTDDGSNLDLSTAGLHQSEERESFRAKRIQKEVEHARKMVEQRVAGIVRQRQLRIERQQQESQEAQREVSKRVPHNKPTPPPPPPLPASTPPVDEPSQNIIRQQSPEASTSTNGYTKELRSTRLSTKVLIENKSHRPASPSPDYSNSPSPTPEQDTKSEQGNVVHLSSYPSIYSRPEPSRLDIFIEKKDGVITSTNEDVLRKKDLENALSRCHVSRPNTNDDIKTNGNGHVTVILNGTRVPTTTTTGKCNGGILKNSSSNSNGQDGGGNLKTISFGKF